MRAVDDDRTRRLAPDASDAVGGQDRHKLRHRSLPSISDPVIMQENSAENKPELSRCRSSLFSAERGKLREKLHFIPNGAAILLFRSIR